MFNLIVSQFGFRNTQDFLHSIIHIPLLYLILPIAAVSSYAEQYFGLKLVTVIAFVCLLTLELITGMMVSRIKRQRLNSKRFSRFGFKVFTWLLLFFIVHSLKVQFKDENLLVAEVFGWLYSIIIIYVTLEYLISVLENIAVISGKSSSKLIQALRHKLDKLLDIEDEEPIN